jgi:hypothetical protein
MPQGDGLFHIIGEKCGLGHEDAKKGAKPVAEVGSEKRIDRGFGELLSLGDRLAGYMTLMDINPLLEGRVFSCCFGQSETGKTSGVGERNVG